MKEYAVFAALCLAGCIGSQYAPKTLPHRPVTPLTNFGQGNNPGPKECPPGTIAYYLDGGTFLECMRGTSA